MGLNLTTAINLFAKEVIRTQAIPFSITADPLDDAEMRGEENRLLNERLDKVLKGDAKFLSSQEVAARMGF